MMCDIEVDVSNWNAMCRICLACSYGNRPIFNESHLEETNVFLERLMSVGNVKVTEGDGLPSKICADCTSQVERSFAFRELCEKSDRALRQVSEGLSSKEEQIGQDELHTVEEVRERRRGRPRKDQPLAGKHHAENSAWLDESVDIKEEDEEDLASAHVQVEVDNDDLSSSDGDSDCGKTETSNLKESADDPIKTACHICGVCNKSFHKESTLRAHEEVHDDEPSPVTCDWCGKTYNTKVELIKHMKVHKGRKIRICEYCNKAFDSRIALERHLPKHTGERPHKCEHCGKCFAVLGTLTKHLRTHTGERPFPCMYCSKAFAHSDSLAIHVRTHTGERPYQCASCGKCFSQLPHLKRHTLIHTGEKPFKCTECDRSFRRSNSLKAHAEQHEWERLLSGDEPGTVLVKPVLKKKKPLKEGKRYKCEICERTFSQVQLLNCHMRVHTGERPYQCTTCGKTFVQAQHLTRHIRVHTGERPYCCAVCGKTYKQSYELKKHSQIHEQMAENVSVEHCDASSAMAVAVNASLNIGGVLSMSPGVGIGIGI